MSFLLLRSNIYMPYIRTHMRPDEKRRRVIITTLAIVAVIVLILELAAPQILPAFANAVARPFWRVGVYVDVGALRSNSSLLAENESLKRDIAGLRASFASSSVAMLESDNRQLLSMLGRATTTPRKVVVAAVLARPSLVAYDGLIIDLGSDDGLSSTTQVYSAEKVLIGHVVSVQSHQSTVALYSSPGETYSVLIGPSRVRATAVGKGGGQYRASVPHGSSVQIGDFVSDSALYDRPFGVVVSIVNDPSDPFDTVLFAPPVNIYETRFVLVDLGKSALPARR